MKIPRFFRSIKARLSLILLIPLSVLLFTVSIDIYRNDQAKSKYEKVDQLTALSVTISQLIHEIQKERGMSAGFIGSKGGKFASELPDQHNQTDIRLKNLRSEISQLELDQYGDSFKSDIQQVISKLDGINSLRKKITGLSISLKSGIGQFTVFNTELLAIIDYLAHISPSGKLSNHAIAYTSFLKSKEAAGIERAVLTGTFAANKFKPGLYEKFISLMENQKTYLSVFLNLSDDDAKKLFQNIATKDPFVATNRMRQIAMDEVVTGNFGVDPLNWFQKQTQKIDLLKTVENYLGEALMEESSDLAESAVSRELVSLIIAIVTAAFSLIFGISLINLLGNETEEMVKALKQVSEGNLSSSVLNKRMEGDAFDALSKMRKSLSEINTSIQASTQIVENNAREISENNQSLAQRAEAQANHLQETAAAMEEISNTVTNNASNAKSCNQLADDARGYADEGREVMAKAVVAMDEINEESEKIANIINVIDEIAFQINLLSLNAAVEAARAGEQGRGFAVVASEVRNLAQMSADSANKIKSLIEGSLTKVKNGGSLVRASDKSLKKIVSSVSDVSNIMGEITHASEEQSVGVQEISRSLMELDSMNQENAAMVEEVAVASHELGSQSRNLKGLTDFFTITEQVQPVAHSNISTKNQAMMPGKERRSANRPWAKKAKAVESQSELNHDSHLKVANSGRDIWKEF